MRKQAQNVFTDGLVTDYHPLTAKNTTLTDALNATLVTTNGNEMVLQNDLGNQKISYTENNETKYVQLGENFIPIGIKEHNGIIYIASYNPKTGKGEIGTFPSPEGDYSYGGVGNLINKYRPLQIVAKVNNYDDSIDPGSLQPSPLTTKLLNFDLQHSVDIEIQASYDGSVNLIFNDDNNIPRLINSGFAVKENGTYEYPKRVSGNQENFIKIKNGELTIDDQKKFDIQTSLIRRTDKFPKVIYDGVLDSGNLKVGNYTLYFKYCDTDGNETDYIAESGLISIFKGKDADPFSIDGGVEDMNANKSIQVTLEDIDETYKFVKVYYVRQSSAADSNRIPQAYEILKEYPNSTSGKCKITITGDEEVQQIPLSEINTQYFVSDSATASTQAQGMLFLGNVQAANPYYQELLNLSLTFRPSLFRREAKTVIGEVSSKDYIDHSNIVENDGNHKYPYEYYNTKNIYYNVGYWNEEYYRLGIVYIYDDNSLSPVFNILGGELDDDEDTKLPDLHILSNSSERDSEGNSCVKVKSITNGLSTNIFINNNGDSVTTPNSNFLNVRGVIKLSDSELESNKAKQFLYTIKIWQNPVVLEYLKEQLGIKGYFFVRQKRIPTIACQAYSMPWDKEAKIPIIEFLGQTTLDGELDNLHSTDSLRWDLQYIVESFLRQVGQEGNGEKDRTLTTNVNLTREVIHDYKARLHYILPFCIDNKIYDYIFESNTDWDNPIGGYALIGSEEGKTGYWTSDMINLAKRKKITSISDLSEGLSSIGSFLGTKTKECLRYYTNRLIDSKGTGAEHPDSSIMKHFYDLYKYCDQNQFTAICPEFELRQPYFNSFFTGAKFTTKSTVYQQGRLVRTNITPTDEGDSRIYYATQNVEGLAAEEFLKIENSSKIFRTNKIVSVTDTVPVVAIDNTVFKSVIGTENEAYRFSYINEEHCATRDLDFYTGNVDYNKLDEHDFNLVRGIYSPYLGITSEEIRTEKSLGYGRTFNIYYDNINNTITKNIEIRVQDNSPYYTISDRYNMDDSPLLPKKISRGDCFLCTFTHRLNRNFNDPVAPTNDHILDPGTWEKNYFPDTKASDTKDKGIEKLNQINRGDINAVKLGSWITIKVRSSYNLSIRSLDESHIQESGIMGRARGFYPLQQASPEGGYKIPNSYIINDGFGATLGEKQYGLIANAPYLKNDFNNRITYSDINVNDSFKNNYRIFRGGHFRDYSKEYGAITKLVELQGNILCIFEHGIALIPVNERALAAEGSGGEVYINNSNVLPETPRILSDMYGSQWKQSIVKTPYYIYGVDVARKKIWRTNGSQFEIISDFRVEKFLVENLPIQENDTLPFIGLKNIVTHYNANKSDVMFTFYWKKHTLKIREECNTDGSTKEVPTDQLNSIEDDELAWNLCYNEILQKFQTFYSWIPIASANIDNQFYSFDRECSREIITTQESENEESDQGIAPSSGVTESDRNEPQTPIAINFPTSRTIPYLWKHGQYNEQFPYPCFWYDEQHPFEFEFVVNEQAGIQKIFNNLIIISNSAEPESFHFTIVGEGYEFNEDKPNMYVRQETTKETLQNLGSNVTYNENYQKLINKGLFRFPKSTIFPLYYRRVNTRNDIYDSYTKMLDKFKSRSYDGLTGAEIQWDEKLNEFNIISHQECVPIDSYWMLVTEEEYNEAKSSGYRCKVDDRGSVKYYYVWIKSSRMRGNSLYQEDQWQVQIAPLTLMQKNETWTNTPPIVINGVEGASDTQSSELTPELLPNTYTIGDVDTSHWTYRKEAKIRDKYCKIRVRYSGVKLAIISAIITTFTLSYN